MGRDGIEAGAKQFVPWFRYFVALQHSRRLREKARRKTRRDGYRLQHLTVGPPVHHSLLRQRLPSYEIRGSGWRRGGAIMANQWQPARAAYL